MNDSFWGRIADSASKYWIGFMIGWIWFANPTPDFWKALGIAVLGVVVIWLFCAILYTIGEIE
jgi:hypothetical protein